MEPITDMPTTQPFSQSRPRIPTSPRERDISNPMVKRKKRSPIRIVPRR
jgi:hypothetical protein